MSCQQYQGLPTDLQSDLNLLYWIVVYIRPLETFGDEMPNKRWQCNCQQTISITNSKDNNLLQ